MSTQGYVLQEDDIKLLKVVLKRVIERALDRFDGLTDEQLLCDLAERIGRITRRIQAGIISPADRADFRAVLVEERATMLVLAQEEWDKVIPINQLLKRLAKIDWEAIDDRELTYDAGEIWRGFRLSEGEIYASFYQERRHSTCQEGYTAIEPGNVVNLVVNDDEEDNAGDRFTVRIIRSQVCAKVCDNDDVPAKMFEAIIESTSQEDRDSEADELYGFVYQDGSTVMLPTSPDSDFVERLITVGVTFM